MRHQLVADYHGERFIRVIQQISKTAKLVATFCYLKTHTMVIYENLPLAAYNAQDARLLMPPPRLPPLLPANRSMTGYIQQQSLYVCSSEVRNRKRYGICGGGAERLPLTPKKNNSNINSPGENRHFELKVPSHFNNLPHNIPQNLLQNLANLQLHHHHPESALQIWLQELQSLTEVESLTALQAKSVATTPESFEALSIRNAQVAIQSIRRHSSAAIDELDCLLDCLPVSIDGLAYLYESFSSTAAAIADVLESCRRKGCDFATNKTLSGDVLTIVEQTRHFMVAFLRRGVVNNAQIEATVRRLREAFGELVDVTLKKECALLVGSLGSKRTRSHLCLKWSLLALWQLTQKDPYMVRLLIEHGNHSIIEHLLEIVQYSSANNFNHSTPQEMSQIKAAALRVLTYLSANSDAVRAILRSFSSSRSNKRFFSITSIFESLDDHLEKATDEGVLKEAVGLLVQLTTPFIDSKERQQQASSEEPETLASKSLLNELVHVLTEIARRNNGNSQIFLMTAAALANITFLSTETLVKYETLGVLVSAARQLQNLQDFDGGDHNQPSDHLLQDQIITLLANMAAKHPLEVVSSGGLIYLLDALLHEEENYFDQNSFDGSTAFFANRARVQQKIAVAVARLATNRSCAKIILKLGGIAKLVRLCKNPSERAHSDTVLLAAIAALKRLSTSVGRGPFKDLGATDLIDEKLQTSFQTYSSAMTPARGGCTSESLV